MRTSNILLVSLSVMLAACQPEVQAPQETLPAAVPPAVSVPVAPAASEVAPVTAPVAEKAAPVVAAKPVAQTATQTTAQTAAQATAPAVAKVESVPVVAAVKPEAKPAAALSEADALQLAKKSGCLNCHAIDRKVFGPAWKEVAAKYRGDAGAEDRLANKIAKGGSGVWGAAMMPPSPQVSEADRRALSRFLLSLK